MVTATRPPTNPPRTDGGHRSRTPTSTTVRKSMSVSTSVPTACRWVGRRLRLLAADTPESDTGHDRSLLSSNLCRDDTSTNPERLQTPEVKAKRKPDIPRSRQRQHLPPRPRQA